MDQLWGYRLLCLFSVIPSSSFPQQFFPVGVLVSPTCVLLCRDLFHLWSCLFSVSLCASIHLPSLCHLWNVGTCFSTFFFPFPTFLSVCLCNLLPRSVSVLQNAQQRPKGFCIWTADLFVYRWLSLSFLRISMNIWSDWWLLTAHVNTNRLLEDLR